MIVSLVIFLIITVSSLVTFYFLLLYKIRMHNIQREASKQKSISFFNSRLKHIFMFIFWFIPIFKLEEHSRYYNEVVRGINLCLLSLVIEFICFALLS